MERFNFIINYHWQQPVVGSASFISVLTRSEVNHIKQVIDFINSHPDSGDTIPEFEISHIEGVEATVVGGKGYHATLDELRQESRYEEGLYEEKHCWLERT